jgi:hypothetical protein
MTKICRKCGKELPIDNYYKNESMSDGYLNQCKECVKSRVGKHREENVESIREYDRNRSHSPERQALRTAITKKRRHEVEGYQACHNKIIREIRKGTMVRSNTCQICSNQGKTEAHHNNYLEKLKVLWLCPCCHRSYHNGKNEKAERIRKIVDLLLMVRDDIYAEED